MKCDLSFMSGYEKECKESKEDCVQWEKFCKKRVKK